MRPRRGDAMHPVRGERVWLAAHLLTGLDELKSRHESVGDVRGAGLYAGIEMVSDRPSRTAAPKFASLVVNGLRREGVLVGLCGAPGQGLKIRPPLTFGTDDADYFLDRLDKVLANLPA